MDWIDKLERKFGRYAIKGLMTYIIGITGFVYIVSLFDPTGNFIDKLTLYAPAVFSGQIWRLITYIFIPPETSPIFIIFALYLYYLIGNGLEDEWGSFRFNLYYLIGMIGTAIAVLLTGGKGTATYLNLSLFLAFAYLYPKYELLIFFVIPVKIKYLAYIDWFFIIYGIITEPLPYKVAAIASVLNFLVFFGKDIRIQMKTRRKSYYNKRKFKSQADENIKIHRCRVCGITSIDHPDMDFRYCSKCDGMQCYCSEHIRNHEHVKKDGNESKVIEFPNKNKDN